MLSRIFQWLSAYFGSAIARFLTGAGLAVVSFGALTAVVTAALTLIVTYFGDLTAAMANIMLLSGFANLLNMIGSAILTRMAITSGALSLRKVA